MTDQKGKLELIIKAKDEAYMSLLRDYEELKVEYNVMNIVAKGFEQIRSEMMEEIAKLKDQIKADMNFEEKQAEEVENLKKENKNLNKQIEQFKKGVNAGTKIIEKLEEENEKLREKIETLELRLDNKEKLNEEYRKQLNGYEM